MCAAICFKICRHWLTRLALERLGGGSRRFVDFLSYAFPTVGVEDSHKLLVLGEKLLQNFCGSC